MSRFTLKIVDARVKIKDQCSAENLNVGDIVQGRVGRHEAPRSTYLRASSILGNLDDPREVHKVVPEQEVTGTGGGPSRPTLFDVVFVQRATLTLEA